MSYNPSYNASRPLLVRFTGIVVEVRISPETRVSGAQGSASSWVKQVGAMTVRVGGKPVTCLIDMRAQNIGVMPGNTVTIWGRARKWKTGDNVPESVDVDRLECDETNEILPTRGFNRTPLIVLPFLLVPVIFVFVFLFVFLGPMFSGGFMGSGGFALVFFLPLSSVVIFIVIVVAIVARNAVAGGRRLSPQRLAEYAEVGPMAAMTIASERSAFAKRCMVCNLEISKADDVVFCPHCGNPAHKEHILEWLKTKDRCPICEKHITEESF